MATSKQEYYFYPGKRSKHRNAGILVIEGKFKFLFNRRSKDGVKLEYICAQAQAHFGCKARARVVKREDGSYFLFNTTQEHNHFVFKAAIIAEELKIKMAEIVEKNPVEPVADAVEKVTLEAKEDYQDDPILLKDILAELGTDHGMQQRLYRVRDRKIGKMPRGREHFNPKELLKRLHGRKGEKVVILDSNNLDDGWEEKIMKTNPNSAYKWDNFSEEMKEYEDSEGNDDENSGQDEKQDVSIDEGISETEEVTVEDLGPEEDTEKTDTNENKKETSKENKKLPERVLAYSTEELLKLFELAERSSVDGTFKSICKLWKQQFIWMLKVKGTVTLLFLLIVLLNILIILIVFNNYVFFSISFQVTGFLSCGDGCQTRRKSATRSSSTL